MAFSADDPYRPPSPGTGIKRIPRWPRRKAVLWVSLAALFWSLIGPPVLYWSRDFLYGGGGGCPDASAVRAGQAYLKDRAPELSHEATVLGEQCDTDRKYLGILVAPGSSEEETLRVLASSGCRGPAWFEWWRSDSECSVDLGTEGDATAFVTTL